MEQRTKVIGGGVSAAALVAILGGGYTTLEKADQRYTLQKEFVQQVAEIKEGLSSTNDRINYNQIQDVIRRKENVVQQIEQRNKTLDRNKWPEADKEYVRDIEKEKRDAERQLNIYEQRVLGK